MQRVAVLVLVLVWCTQTVQAQQGIGLTLNNVDYTNNSVVTITDIGTGGAALLCTTTYRPCCFSVPPPGNHWYFPNGSQIDRFNTTPYYRSRGDASLDNPGRIGAVILHRNPEGTTTGVFRCEILSFTRAFQSIYVGIYTTTTGSPHVTNLTYNGQSYTLTCTSTGGPATTVTWRRNGSVITLNATHQQTKTVVDPVAGTYQTVLTINPSVGPSGIVGTYNCTVENARGKSSMTVVETESDAGDYISVSSPFLSRARNFTGTYTISVHAPTGPPLGFTVTPGERNITFSWSPPAPTLRNGVITGYFLSCVSNIGWRNSISMQYTAAGTFILRGFTPVTSYNCSITARNIWGNGPIAYRINSTLDDLMLFQLQLSLPITCQMWIGSDTSAKLSDVIVTVVQNTERLCRCGFNAENITDSAFQCFQSLGKQVTFQARLHGTANVTSIQLIEYIQQWISTEIHVVVQGVRVDIDTCPVAITSFQDHCPETTQPTSDTTQTTLTMLPTNMETMSNSTTTETTSDSNTTETTSDSTTTETALLYTTASIVGGVVAVLILAMTFIVIAVLVTKNRKHKYSTDQNVGKQPHNWSGVTESSTTDITTTQCEAYKLTKRGQEHEVVSEPEYDAIPTFEGKQDNQNKSPPSPVATLQETGGKMEEA